MWRKFRLMMIIHVIPFLLKIIIHVIELPSLMMTFSTNSYDILWYFFDAWSRMSLWLDRQIKLIYICIYNTLADMISMLEEPIYPNTFFAGILNQATQRLLNNRSASKLQTPFTTWTGRNCSQKTLPWLGPGDIFWGLGPAYSRNILKRGSFHKSENVTMIILSVLLSIWRIFLFNQSESCLGYFYRWNDHKCSYLSQQFI